MSGLPPSVSDEAPVYLDNQSTTPCDPPGRRGDGAVLHWSASATPRAAPTPTAARRATRRSGREPGRRCGSAPRPRRSCSRAGRPSPDNLALLGAARARRADDGRRTSSRSRRSTVPCSIRSPRWCGRGSATVVPVGGDGLVDPARCAAARRPDTAVVSVMLANNEIGVVQPVGRSPRSRHAWARGCIATPRRPRAFRST